MIHSVVYFINLHNIPVSKTECSLFIDSTKTSKYQYQNEKKNILQERKFKINVLFISFLSKFSGMLNHATLSAEII